jgi:hypothetical protein
VQAAARKRKGRTLGRPNSGVHFCSLWERACDAGLLARLDVAVQLTATLPQSSGEDKVSTGAVAAEQQGGRRERQPLRRRLALVAAGAAVGVAGVLAATLVVSTERGRRTE